MNEGNNKDHVGGDDDSSDVEGIDVELDEDSDEDLMRMLMRILIQNNPLMK